MAQQRADIHSAGVPVVCESCEARHGGICGALKDTELLKLSRHTSIKSVPAGTELIGEEEAFNTYANILAGVVKLTKIMPDGRQQIVGLQFAPDFLGRPFHSSSMVGAEAASDVTLCVFSKGALDAMLQEVPGLEHRLLRQTLNELDDAREWMLTLGRKTAEEKVSSFLHMIARNIEPDRDIDREGSAQFDLPLTRADIADFLGLTIETVSRQLTKLRKAGIVEIANNRHIVIPDVESLRERTGT